MPASASIRAHVRGQVWSCPLCFTRNHFPQHYAEISESNLPGELFPTSKVAEYVLPPQRDAMPPAFLFLLDTCLDDADLREAALSVRQSASLLPEGAFVGLITFGGSVQVRGVRVSAGCACVQHPRARFLLSLSHFRIGTHPNPISSPPYPSPKVHELGFQGDVCKQYVFRGDLEDYPAEKVRYPCSISVRYSCSTILFDSSSSFLCEENSWAFFPPEADLT